MVAALTLRCRDKYSWKKRCTHSLKSEVFMIVALRTLSGHSHEFRQSVEIPVGIADVMVTQIPREDQDPTIRSLATGLPVLQHSAGMCVTQIVNPRSMAIVGNRPAQP